LRITLSTSICDRALCGKLPISTRLKVFREFDAVNHLEGTSGFVTVSLPLAIDTSGAAAAAGKSIKAKF
jgi:hypothetical protein